VNAYYHRRYDEYQPVEVNIMPDMIEIISYGGAERSIRLDDLRAGKRVHARRYRNPRLGEFLNELHLTEGRGTGLPTIREELKKNGSPDFTIDVDDEHTYFIIRIPCHPEFVCDELTMDKDGHILPLGEVWNPDVTEDGTDNVTDKLNVTDADTESVTNNVIGYGTDNGTEDVTDKLNVTDVDTESVTNNVTDNVTDNVTEGGTDISTAEKRRIEILRLMKLDSKITTDNLANILHVSRMTISRDINLMRSQNKLKREGDDFGGNWVVL
ncbi:MAG: HTH domain-containing protein, partial [Bacteroidales bacterium]|nr:HTH domain-containing protein [Bacteroidales bacterium]